MWRRAGQRPDAAYGDPERSLQATNGRENCWGETCTLERTQTKLCALDVTTRNSWNSDRQYCVLYISIKPGKRQVEKQAGREGEGAVRKRKVS